MRPVMTQEKNNNKNARSFETFKNKPGDEPLSENRVQCPDASGEALRCLRCLLNKERQTKEEGERFSEKTGGKVSSSGQKKRNPAGIKGRYGILQRLDGGF